MNRWKKLFIASNIAFICLGINLVISGCKQVEGAQHGAIYGTVQLLNQSDHSGVTVTARNGTAVSEATTEQSGGYVITGLTEGTYEVTVSKNNWYVPDGQVATKSVVITSGESVMNVDFTLESDLYPPAIPQ